MKKRKNPIKNKNLLIGLFAIILILFFIVLVFGFENIKLKTFSFFGDEKSILKQECKSQCLIENKTNYCCGARFINKTYYNCQDEFLDTNCEIDCSGVCEDFCSKINIMLDCARFGCQWIVKPEPIYGYCRAKPETL